MEEDVEVRAKVSSRNARIYKGLRLFACGVSRPGAKVSRRKPTECLILLRVFNDLIMRGLPTATPRFPKGFHRFRSGDLDTFKMDHEFPLFLIVSAAPAEKLVLLPVFTVFRDFYHVSCSQQRHISVPRFTCICI